VQPPSPDGLLLCLVRHGETDWNSTGRRQGRQDIALNDTGRLQAQRTAAYLKRWQWDAVLSSPLSRSADTAAAIAQSLGVTEVRYLDDLVEVDYGEASGLLPEEADARWPDGNFPGRETREESWMRARGVMEALLAQHPGKRLVVVSHGGLINAMLAVASQGEIGSGKTVLGNGSISVVRYEEGRWTVESYNSGEHMTAD
jgi:uncharacterized phosphatase